MRSLVEPLLEAPLDAGDALRGSASKDSAPGSACSGAWSGIQETWPVPVVVRRGGAVGVGLADLVEVLVGLVRQAEDLADRLRGLLRAAVRAGEDRLDPLAAQPLPQAAGLLPAALGQAVAVLAARPASCGRRRC